MSDVHEAECAIHKGWHGETPCAWCMKDEIFRLHEHNSRLRYILQRIIDEVELPQSIEQRTREALGDE